MTTDPPPGPGREPGIAYRDALLRLVQASTPGMRLGLESTRQLLAQLDNPEVGLPGVLVAGTNGKGSVCALVAAMASRAGVRVALLTKPHLTSYRERIQLGGRPIDERLFTQIATAVSDAADRMALAGGRPTHHELLTAMGFLAARQGNAELVVCEVGLGGRLDATNVWDGGVAALTSIALDHQAQLGNTVAAIAQEKAAIIKPGNLVVAAVPDEALAAVERAARAAPARLWKLGQEIRVSPSSGAKGFRVETPATVRDHLEVGLEGAFQVGNAAVAVAIADCLGELGFPLPDEAVREGLARASWAGRLQTLGEPPWCLIDAAHNPAAVEAVIPEIHRVGAGRPVVLLFGAMEDHDHRGMLELLAQVDFSATVLTRAGSARAAAPSLLAQNWNGPCEKVEAVDEALGRARHLAGPTGLVVALGSIYVIGEVMAALGIGVPPDPNIPFPPLW
ncbi:MAG TPA: Mur ligase family protein [Candidatus Dormibacteraeota bacterium]